MHNFEKLCNWLSEISSVFVLVSSAFALTETLDIVVWPVNYKKVKKS